jgi:small subunit ribosomal protein S1
MIIELNKNERKISLSIKALEEKQTKETVKKYGSKDSGALLGEILGPLLKKNKEKNNK